MNLTDIANAISSQIASAIAGLGSENRPLRLRILGQKGELEGVFLAHTADIRESLNDGIEGCVVCVSPFNDLLLQSFEGALVDVDFVTDTGTVRTVRAIVLRAVRGHGDEKLSLYQFTLVDPLRILDEYVDTNIVENASVIEVTEELLGDARRACPGLGVNFTFDWQVHRPRYPRRAFWLQKNESLSGFLRRQWRRFGINYFFRPDDQGRIELVLFDRWANLASNAAGEISFFRQDGTQKRDAVLHFAEGRQLVSGAVRLKSWDYKNAMMKEAESVTQVDHGVTGRDFSAFLGNRRITRPHAGNDAFELQNLADLQMSRQDFMSAWACGIASVRQLAVCESNVIANLPGRQFALPDETTYVFTEVHRLARNNLGELDDSVAQLLDSSAQLHGWTPMRAVADHDPTPAQAQRYLCRFAAVRLGTAIVPEWDPDKHLPRPQPLTVIIAGADGETVDVDELGRLLFTIPGERTGRKSGRARYNATYAGNREGLWLPLKCGMEGALDWEDGDESRPVITRVHFNSANQVPLFDHAGSVVGNRYLAGLHLHEIGGSRYGELLFDMTTGQISVSLGSEHARSRLQLGSLHGTRRDGQADPLGEGFYLHTLAAGAVQTAQALLLSSYGRRDNSTPQLDMPDHLSELVQGMALLKALGDYAADHQGLAMDEKARNELKGYVEKAAAGSNVDPDATGGGAPTINLTAPAGIATTTPKTIFTVAGVNIDAVAGLNLQLTSGQFTVINAAKGVSLFAREGGVHVIAHQGTLALQSQHGDTQVDAGGNLTLNAIGGRLLGQAKDEILFKTAGGAYLKLSGGSVELGGSEPLKIKTAGHHWEGPNTMSANMPSFAAPVTPKVCVQCLLAAAAAGAPVSMK